MEKRIRIVWILSLVSALLVIVVQVYWLYNQYQFVLNGYTDEIAAGILKAGDAEYEIRKNKTNTAYSLVMDSNREYTSADSSQTVRTNNRVGIIFNGSSKKSIDSADSESIRDSIYRESLRSASQALDSLLTAAPKYKEEAKDSFSMQLFVNPKLSQDSIQLFMGRAMINTYQPFNRQVFDSLLHASNPGHRFDLSEWQTADTIYKTHWQRTGSLMHPRIEVHYAYSPFQREGVVVQTDIPAQPLFKRMGIQLLLASAFVLLLIGCLVFQIRTILKQRKIGELRQGFVNTMIHELKRPVQTLKTFVAFLGDKDMRADEDITNQVVHDSMFELDNLTAYLNKLKDMVRADDTRTPLNPTHFNLEELTDKVIRLTHIPPGKEVEFVRYFDMQSPVIEADAIHLANVLSNLIENAIKYSADKVQIEIKARMKRNELWITVSDDGIGIPLTDQDKVFAKFYRGSNMPHDTIPGLGLGLSYVKLISEAHQGTVSLQSHPGEGTSVTLYLPQ